MNWWNIHQCRCLRPVQCRFRFECVCTRERFAPRVWQSNGDFDPCVIFFDSFDHYQAWNIACLERDGFLVDSWYPLLLSMWHVIRWDRSPYSGVILIDLRFSWLLSFRILCVLHLNGQLVDHTQDIAFEEDRVQLMKVLVQLGACCTLSLVVTTWLWSIYDFFWIVLINIERWISLVWSETVLVSIVGVLERCPCDMSFVQPGAIQTVVYWLNHPFFYFMSFWTLYILCINGQLVYYKPDIAFEEDRVQLMSVCALEELFAPRIW